MTIPEIEDATKNLQDQIIEGRKELSEIYRNIGDLRDQLGLPLRPAPPECAKNESITGRRF